MPLTRVTSNVIQDGTIIDADISASANISRNKFQLSNPAGVATCYISTRTDGIAGTGTFADPFDGSTQQKFDTIIQNVAPNTTIKLLPGNYQTYKSGGFFGNSRMPDGVSIIGDGINTTKITCVGQAAGSTGAIFCVRGHNTRFSDLTIDCNYQAHRLSGNKVEAFALLGDNCIVERVKAINYGGDPDALVECFVIFIYGNNGTIQNCVLEQPQPSYNGKYYISGCVVVPFLSGYGLQTDRSQPNGVIRNNTFIGANFPANYITCQFSGPLDNCVVEQNYVENATCGVYADSYTFQSAWIKNNTFVNCTVSMMYQMGLGQVANKVPKQVYFQYNKIYIGNNSAPWGNCYFAHSESLYLEGNYFTKTDNFSLSPFGLIIWIRNVGTTPDYLNGGNGLIHFKYNVVEESLMNNVNGFIQIGESNLQHAQNLYEENNTDEKGLPVFSFAKFLPSVTVKSNTNLTPEQNGIVLMRAFNATLNAIPYFQNRSATNIPTLYIEAGRYRIPTVLPFTNPTIGFRSWVGIGRPEEVIIESISNGDSNGALMRFDNGDYYKFKNLTFKSGSSQVMFPPYVTGGANSIFENCIFEDNNAGNGSVTGGNGLVSLTFKDCLFNCRIQTGNSPFNSNAKLISCKNSPNKDIITIIGGELQDCVLYIQSSFNIRGLIKNCTFIGTDDATDNYIQILNGTVYPTTFVENCRFQNIRIIGGGIITNPVYVMYSSVLSKSTQTNSFDQSGYWIFNNVASNKPVSGTVNITQLTQI